MKMTVIPVVIGVLVTVTKGDWYGYWRIQKIRRRADTEWF